MFNSESPERLTVLKYYAVLCEANAIALPPLHQCLGKKNAPSNPVNSSGAVRNSIKAFVDFSITT